MNYTEMKTLLEYYVDDVVDTATAVRLLNEGKNKLAVAVRAKFPDIDASGASTFVFDDRFHEAPVLYAASMVKAYDSSLSEKESYMAQFRDMLRDFVKEYSPPVQYLASENLQHFGVGLPEGEDTFIITDSSFSGYGDLEVFVDSMPVGFSSSGRNVYLTNTAPAGTVVTVRWEPSMFSAPRYMRGW